MDEIHHAIWWGQSEKVKQLIAENKYNCRDISLIRFACKRGHKNIVTILLEAGCRINIDKYEYWKQKINLQTQNRTPLMWAIYNNHYGIVQILIKHKTDVNEIDKSGSTALINVCTLSKLSEEDAIKYAQLLISASANVNIQNKAGFTKKKKT